MSEKRDRFKFEIRQTKTQEEGLETKPWRSLLLGLLGGVLLDELLVSGLGGLVLLGMGHTLLVLRQAEIGLAAAAAHEAVGVLGHVGGGGAIRALLLELLDLAIGLHVEVLEGLELALLVRVLDDHGRGVCLLLALTLATLGINQGGDGRALGEASLSQRLLVLNELSGAEDQAVDGVLNSGLDLGSIAKRSS